MSEEILWKTWKKRWTVTETNAIDIVKEIFRLVGVQVIHKAHLEKFNNLHGEDGLDFAIELGWLKDCLTGYYKLTCSGLLMLAHQLKT